jgi:hypothetical protein
MSTVDIKPEWIDKNKPKSRQERAKDRVFNKNIKSSKSNERRERIRNTMTKIYDKLS